MNSIGMEWLLVVASAAVPLSTCLLRKLEIANWHLVHHACCYTRHFFLEASMPFYTNDYCTGTFVRCKNKSFHHLLLMGIDDIFISLISRFCIEHFCDGDIILQVKIIMNSFVMCYINIEHTTHLSLTAKIYRTTLHTMSVWSSSSSTALAAFNGAELTTPHRWIVSFPLTGLWFFYFNFKFVILY